MKNLFNTILIAVVLIASVSLAKENSKSNFKEKAVKNLLIGLNSENFGLKTSSAYLLGEITDSKSVIPLMRILRNDKNENARIIAALSLCKIGDAIGVQAVKQAARFDDSERVRNLCARFYYYHNELENRLAIAQR